MATVLTHGTRPTVGAAVWIGRVMSGLAIAFLAMDAGGKLIAPGMMIANSPPLGLPDSPAFYQLLGGILAVCTLLYAVPRTAIFGAVLMTGYLGGAVAIHLRVASPLLGFTLFGVYLGLLDWGGLWLRDPALRALFPILK
jgi:hypothetical protein